MLTPNRLDTGASLNKPLNNNNLLTQEIQLWSDLGLCPWDWSTRERPSLLGSVLLSEFRLISDGMVELYIRFSFGDWANALECWRSLDPWDWSYITRYCCTSGGDTAIPGMIKDPETFNIQVPGMVHSDSLCHPLMLSFNPHYEGYTKGDRDRLLVYRSYPVLYSTSVRDRVDQSCPRDTFLGPDPTRRNVDPVWPAIIDKKSDMFWYL